MDTSKEYIKMCDCPEIQGRWERKIGDFALNVPYNKSTPITYIVCGQTWGKDIWLPTQSQLQEMVIDKLCYPNSYGKMYNLMHPIYHYWLNWSERYDAQSMNQLWLAFVMKELHNKIWDGETWQI